MKMMDWAVITAGSEASSMPATNLAHMQPRRRWRATASDQVEATFNMTAALAASTVEQTGLTGYRLLVLGYSTASRDSTLEVFCGNSQVEVADSGAPYYLSRDYWLSLDNDRGRFPLRHTWLEFPSLFSYPWVRFKITDPNFADLGYLDTGIALLHPGYYPTLPLAEQPTANVDEERREIRSLRGARHLQRRPRERLRDYNLQATGDNAPAEAEAEWLGLQEAVGVSEPVVVIDDLDATTRTMNRILYGTLENLSKLKIPETWGLGRIDLSVRELL